MNPPPVPAEPRRKILIAEDSATQALLLQSILERHGFEVLVARNGRLALETLPASAPILIVTDVQMPEMDGYELCRRVKADPALKDIPVMLLTSLSSPKDIIHGLECGADNFVVKPYEETFLMARIHAVLANRDLLRHTDGEGGITVEFASECYVIEASRRQILNLLLSTYETALKTNHDLIEAHEQLKATQAQLIEAEKLQSVGRLAAGVAHEVRNPLAIMEMGVSFLSSQAMPEDNEIILKEMSEAVQRANHVITGLMDLSPREMGIREVDVESVIEHALASLESVLAEGKVEVVREFADGLPTSALDEGKIEQVLINVLNNAIQAMPEGGALTVRTSVKRLGAGEVAFNVGNRAGAAFREGDRAIVIEVRDTGSGILPENLNKLFEPFFSTKPTGQGMGLGLTVARKIVELHHGTITLQNCAAGGVIVTITFKAT